MFNLLLYLNLILKIHFTFRITIRDVSLRYGLDVFIEGKKLPCKFSFLLSFESRLFSHHLLVLLEWKIVGFFSYSLFINVTLFFFLRWRRTIRWWNYDEDWLVWYFKGMIEDFSDKFTVVVLDRILFEITGWYGSALNENWSLLGD